MKRLPIILLLFAAACSDSSPTGVSDIDKKKHTIDTDELVVERKLDMNSHVDSIVQVSHFKGGHLVKYQQNVYKGDTLTSMLFYAWNDSLIYSENVALDGRDTMQFSRLYFRNGECVKADERLMKTDPDFAFSAGQKWIESARKQ